MRPFGFVIGRSVFRTVRASWNTEYEGPVLGLTAMLVAWAISGLFADLFIDTLVFFYLGFLSPLTDTCSAVPLQRCRCCMRHHNARFSRDASHDAL